MTPEDLCAIQRCEMTTLHPKSDIPGDFTVLSCPHWLSFMTFVALSALEQLQYSVCLPWITAFAFHWRQLHRGDVLLWGQSVRFSDIYAEIIGFHSELCESFNPVKATHSNKQQQQQPQDNLKNRHFGSVDLALKLLFFKHVLRWLLVLFLSAGWAAFCLQTLIHRGSGILWLNSLNISAFLQQILERWIFCVWVWVCVMHCDCDPWC